MSKVIITDSTTKPRLNPILEFQHHWKKLPNRAYAINAVDMAISRKQHVIKLDPNKLTHKVYTGTTCRLLDREGEPLTINNRPIDLETLNGHWVCEQRPDSNVVINGCSRPQHGDKFCKHEGRKQALINSLSKLNFKECETNFKDLLDVKLFLKQFELNSNVENISWEFMDLWNGFLDDIFKGTTTRYTSPKNLISLEEAAINYVGLVAYEEHFEAILKDLRTRLEDVFEEITFMDVYGLFKFAIRRSEVTPIKFATRNKTN